MLIDSFDRLFVILLSDIYAFELFIAEALPKMARKAYAKDLKDALQDHLRDTKQQIGKIEKIFKSINEAPLTSEWLNATKVFLERTQKVLDDNHPSSVIDSLIIAIVQRIEHYEIATYGTLCEYAEVLDYHNACQILEELVKEAGREDKVLTKLAKGGLFTKGINRRALALSK